MLERTLSAFGGVNVLVNNAGILHIGTAEQLTDEQWDETFNTNVRGLWLFSRAVLPHMRKAGGGSIINVASVLGINGARNRSAYSASKGAVVLLTKCMAIDHGQENIRVNAICPSFVETELTAVVMSKATDPDAVRRERVERASHRPPGPAGRYGRTRSLSRQRRIVLGDGRRVSGGWGIFGGVKKHSAIQHSALSLSIQHNSISSAARMALSYHRQGCSLGKDKPGMAEC